MLTVDIFLAKKITEIISDVCQNVICIDYNVFIKVTLIKDLTMIEILLVVKNL